MSVVSMENQTTTNTTTTSSESIPNNVTNVSLAKKKVKRTKNKAVPATRPPIDYQSLEMPYVVLLNKKIRSCRKKLEKIKSLEQQREEKSLNEQQLELLSNKTFYEKMNAEYEALREQYVEMTMEEKEQEKASTKKDAEEPVEEPMQEETNESKEFQDVENILRLLHVVSINQALGKPVPAAVDYFAKVLLGKTRPPAELTFHENLAESMEEAKKYLNQCSKVVACDMSYRNLMEFVDNLVLNEKTAEKVEQESDVVLSYKLDHMMDQVVLEEANNAVISETIASVPAVQINFFTDSQLSQDEQETEETTPVQQDTDEEKKEEECETTSNEDGSQENNENSADEDNNGDVENKNQNIGEKEENNPWLMKGNKDNKQQKPYNNKGRFYRNRSSKQNYNKENTGNNNNNNGTTTKRHTQRFRRASGKFENRANGNNASGSNNQREKPKPKAIAA